MECLRLYLYRDWQWNCRHPNPYLYESRTGTRRCVMFRCFNTILYRVALCSQRRLECVEWLRLYLYNDR